VNPVAHHPVRGYGIGHDHDFDQDRLVVGLLTAAGRTRMCVKIVMAAAEFPGGHFVFRWAPDPARRTDGD
jgi:hypothetical protein